MRVDKSGRNQAAAGVDLMINCAPVFFADELDPIAAENYDTVFDDLVASASETDDEAALDECLHYSAFPISNRETAQD